MQAQVARSESDLQRIEDSPANMLVKKSVWIVGGEWQVRPPKLL
jgi:hypothetical protein